MAAGKVEVLLVVQGFNEDRGAEVKLVNTKEGEMGGKDGPCKLDG